MLFTKMMEFFEMGINVLDRMLGRPQLQQKPQQSNDFVPSSGDEIIAESYISL